MVMILDSETGASSEGGCWRLAIGSGRPMLVLRVVLSVFAIALCWHAKVTGLKISDALPEEIQKQRHQSMADSLLSDAI